MNKELEEAVKILKEIQETNKIWMMQTKEENCEKIYLRDIEAIETVLKELKRLQEDYIAKNKIIEKLEENNKLIEECREDEVHCGEIYLYETNNKDLKELLEGK